MAAFRLLRSAFPNISKVYLYALEGTLLDVPWTKLPHGVKDALLSDLNARDAQ